MLIHCNLEFNIENREARFPKATMHMHVMEPTTLLLHLKTTTKTSSNPVCRQIISL